MTILKDMFLTVKYASVVVLGVSLMAYASNNFDNHPIIGMTLLLLTFLFSFFLIEYIYRTQDALSESSEVKKE